MRVAFYIEDKGYNDVDIGYPEKGNPGIGGTWYEFALVASTLAKYNTDWNVYIYHYNRNSYPNICNTVTVCDFEELFNRCEEDKIDILIYKTNKDNQWYLCLNSHKVKCVAWAHTFTGYMERKQIENSLNVVRMVCVGREHYDNYIDEDIATKSMYIYNMVCKADSYYRNNYGSHNVTYIGSIIPVKSFHKLAKAWRKVINAVPDAKLNVIGSGNLYNKDSQLGRYGIAESGYEKKFIKYLLDEKGNMIESVHFWGVLGEEKRDVILSSSVGVVNPTTKSETFCISAVEFEQYGVPVCSGRKNGLLDTVIHQKTGLLSLSTNGLARNIIKLLTDEELNKDYGYYARIHSRKFSPEKLVDEWTQCIIDAYKDEKPIYIQPSGNWLYNGKILRVAVRYIRYGLGIKNFPSCGKVVFYLKMVVKKVMWKLESDRKII